MKIRYADKSLLPQMKTLWQQCFGDSETYIEQYYDRFGVENSVVIERDGFLYAMGSCIPVDYVQPDGDVQKGAYLYAVCTHPDFRHQNCCFNVCEAAASFKKAEGCDFLFLRPGEPSLVKMYEKFGFTLSLTASKQTFAATPSDGVTFRTLTAQDYAMYRQMLLQGGFIDWQAEALGHQASQGELLAISGEDSFAIAAVDGERCAEFLGDTALAGALAGKLGLPSVCCRMPGTTPFAMAKALTNKPLPTGYAGFVFD